MYDLKDVTFMIPVRIRDEDRLNNVRLVTRYINKYFDTNIIVCESSSKQVLTETDIPGCRYIYLQDDTEVFNRTKTRNFITRETNTPYVVCYDVDVLLPIQNYIHAIKQLRCGDVDFVFPYDGKFYNVPKELHNKFYHMIINGTENISIKPHECVLIHNSSVGGAVFMNKQSFIDCGMENENFFTWGYEDNERVIRWKKLDKKISRVFGALYHLDHIQSESTMNNSTLDNKKEIDKIRDMTKEELINYMKTWDWLK